MGPGSRARGCEGTRTGEMDLCRHLDNMHGE